MSAVNFVGVGVVSASLLSSSATDSSSSLLLDPNNKGKLLSDAHLDLEFVDALFVVAGMFNVI